MGRKKNAIETGWKRGRRLDDDVPVQMVSVPGLVAVLAADS